MRMVYPLPAYVSNSQVAALLPTRAGSCPLRWAFERRFRMASAGSLAMELGSALDDGLNEMLRPTLAGMPVSLPRGLVAMRARVDLIPDSLADGSARLKEADALEAALRGFHDAHGNWQGQDVQFEFMVEYDGTPIKGIVDRIDADGRIVDHKLSRSQHVKDGALDPEWLAERRPQLALYLACMALAEEQPVGSRTKAALEVCYATARLKTPQWHYEPLEIGEEEQVQALKDAVTTMALRDGGVYPARPGRHCGFCDFVEDCSEVQSMLALRVEAIAGALEEGHG